MQKILVTGAAGRVGRHIARRLSQEKNVALRLTYSRATPRAPLPHAEAMVANYHEPEQMRAAFHAIDAAFVYAPEMQASHAVFNAAREAGVKKIVLLSSASVSKAPAGANPIAERHRAAENAIRSAGLDWTFIRPDTLASNCLQWAANIRAQGRVYTAYPESLRSALHEDDLALLAVASLLGSQHVGSVLEITGSQLLSIREQVETIAAQLGSAVQCVQIAHEEALQRMQADTALAPQSAARLLDYQKKSVTTPPRLTDVFEQATGCAPRSFSAWVADNLADFQSSASNPW